MNRVRFHKELGLVLGVIQNLHCMARPKLGRVTRPNSR